MHSMLSCLLSISALAYGARLSLKVALSFVGLVVMRLAVPRYKLETVSRMGWVSILAFIALNFAVYSLAWWFY